MPFLLSKVKICHKNLSYTGAVNGDKIAQLLEELELKNGARPGSRNVEASTIKLPSGQEKSLRMNRIVIQAPKVKQMPS